MEGIFREEVIRRGDFIDNGLNFRKYSGRVGGVGEKWEKRIKEWIYRVLWGLGCWK